VAGVRLEKLSKWFGATRAVREVDLVIPDGEFTVFVGPSGCGKTTTLNLIAGLETPTSGDIYIGNDRVTDWEPRDRNLGMVFQSLALFPHMNVFDNIGFPLRVRRVPAAEIAAAVTAVAQTVRVDHLLDKKPATLSGGEAQRVALARTIIVHPAVFLMDEPLSSLDAKLRVEMRTELKRLHATLRATFIYVTHDQAEAMTMADRIVVMHAGVVQQVGAPLSLYNEPVNRFVAGFFGVPAMNFLEGELADGHFSAHPVRLRAPLGGPARRASLGIRPEHVQVLGGDEGWAATVSLIEPLGDETLVFLDYGGPASLVAKVDAEEKITPGDRRRFAFKEEKLLFFDGETGGRIAP
jgi:multiple sugar transport system ATP-binding protein